MVGFTGFGMELLYLVHRIAAESAAYVHRSVFAAERGGGSKCQRADKLDLLFVLGL